MMSRVRLDPNVRLQFMVSWQSRPGLAPVDLKLTGMKRGREHGLIESESDLVFADIVPSSGVAFEVFTLDLSSLSDQVFEVNIVLSVVSVADGHQPMLGHAAGLTLAVTDLDAGRRLDFTLGEYFGAIDGAMLAAYVSREDGAWVLDSIDSCTAATLSELLGLYGIDV